MHILVTWTQQVNVVLKGIILEYELRDGTREMKEIDLLHLTAE